MMKAQHVIWSNYDLDYERDWKGLLEEEYPDMTEEERELLMYEMNNSYLDDERCNLNIQLDCPIIVIADLGLWHGRASGYREIESGNVRDCLYSGRSIEYSTWFVDDLGDLRCTAIHHDGRNHLPYRVYKENATDAQIERLKEKLYAGTATRADITRVTRRLGDEIAAAGKARLIFGVVVAPEHFRADFTARERALQGANVRHGLPPSDPGGRVFRAHLALVGVRNLGIGEGQQETLQARL